jgi:ATP-dependent Clp protease ATP-binding subunit ClpA
LGILDKASLTLGDNRRVDFSRTLIFMTSNLGAAEMGAILRPGLGFTSHAAEQEPVDDKMAGRVSRAGVEAARRKFTPEFLNRIDRTVVFNSLGAAELRQIVDLELKAVQERIFKATGTNTIQFTVDDRAKDFLLTEGTDVRYGARHLKRAVERSLVQPMSNLIATGQVQSGDQLTVEFDSALWRLVFLKEFPETAPQAGEKSAAA